MDEFKDPENEEAKVIKKLNPKLVPETVAILDCKDDDIIDRIYEFSDEKSRDLE